MAGASSDKSVEQYRKKVAANAKRLSRKRTQRNRITQTFRLTREISHALPDAAHRLNLERQFRCGHAGHQPIRVTSRHLIQPAKKPHSRAAAVEIHSREARWHSIKYEGVYLKASMDITYNLAEGFDYLAVMLDWATSLRNRG